MTGNLNTKRNKWECDVKMVKEIPFELPTFKGYTVDPRLRQFRKVIPQESIEFIDFNSEEGQGLLAEMREYFSFLDDELDRIDVSEI